MRKVLTSLIVAAFLGITIWSCSSDDSDSSTSPSNYAPVISELISTAVQVAPDGTSDLYCFATDEDGDALTYTWTFTGGSITGTGSIVTWTAPAEIGTDTIKVVVSDGTDSVNKSVVITVTATPTNPPVIISLTANDYSIEPSTTTNLMCNATDADGDILSYVWTCTGGSVIGANQAAQWTAPALEGSYIVTCTVSDPTVKTSVERSVTIVVAENLAPVISKLTADPASVVSGGSTVITCTATDANGDDLTYTWTKTGGTITGTGSSITWTAPNNTSTYTITCTVSDGQLNDAALIQITVTSLDPGSVWRIITQSYTCPSYPADNSTTSFTYDQYNRLVTGTDVSSYYTDLSTLYYADNVTKLPYRLTTEAAPVKQQAVLEYETLWSYENGKVKTMSEIGYDYSGEETDREENVFTYSGDLMTECVNSLYFDGILEELWVEAYTYNNGKLTEINAYDEELYYRIKISYSGSLAVRAEVSLSLDGITWMAQNTTDFSYNNNQIYGSRSYSQYSVEQDSTKFQYSGSKLIEKLGLYFDTAEWTNNYRENFGYDGYENLSNESFYYWDEMSTSFGLEDQYQYAYQPGMGNFTEIMKCFEPEYFYTGGFYQMIDPMPVPTKDGSKTDVKRKFSQKFLKDKFRSLKERVIKK